jgi:hypothetical protein
MKTQTVHETVEQVLKTHREQYKDDPATVVMFLLGEGGNATSACSGSTIAVFNLCQLASSQIIPMLCAKILGEMPPEIAKELMADAIEAKLGALFDAQLLGGDDEKGN